MAVATLGAFRTHPVVDSRRIRLYKSAEVGVQTHTTVASEATQL